MNKKTKSNIQLFKRFIYAIAVISIFLGINPAYADLVLYGDISGQTVGSDPSNDIIGNLYNHGASTLMIINNGGTEYIYSDGASINATINAGGTQTVDGGTSAGATINAGGTQNILSGSAVSHVSNAGTVNLNSGGNFSNYTNTASTGMLNLYGTNSIHNLTNLGNGRVVFVHDTIAHNTVQSLTVDNLSANNAIIKMGVNLQDQTADKIIVNGAYNGTAQLSLTNLTTVANPTTGTGIKLINFVAESHGTGTFSLSGGQWDEGGYIYKLFNDAGDYDYYLRSTNEYTDSFKTMLNVPTLSVVMAKAGMDSLTKRMGELRDMNNHYKKYGLWLRSYYKNMTVDDLIKTDMSLFGVEVGYDWVFRRNEPMKIFAGLMGGYMQTISMKTKNSNDSNNDGDGYAPSAGAYLTFANDDNWFIDIAARHFWTEIKNTTSTSSARELKFKPKRNIMAASIEAGKTVTSESIIKVEPKLQFNYARAGEDNVKVTSGTGNLEYDATTYFSGKAAVMFSLEIEHNERLVMEPLIELAYNHEFKGKGKVRYGGAEEVSSLRGGSFEAAAGFSMQLSDNIYWHALGTYEKGSKISGWGANAGIRFSFGGNSDKKRPTYAELKNIKKNIRPTNYDTPKPTNGRYHINKRYKTFR